MGIEVRNIGKQFGAFAALDNISLSINSGELVALLGPSGSGKTTLLRIIAGMESADVGEILLYGAAANNKPAGERNVGFVFQHYALFRHMTVFDNIAFGLTVRPKETRPSKAAIRERVFNLLKMVHLENFHDRYPHQLSGGQRQRVALARALAVEPKMLLLDEPFGALDAKVRQELRRWLRRLHDEIHLTSVFVTHDQEEAMEVADRVVVMSNGRIEQIGTPEEVYHHPANAFVYDFLGNYNEFTGWQENAGSALNLIDYERQTDAPAGAKIVKVFARPHDMDVSKTDTFGGESIAAKVMHINPAGALVKLELERVRNPGLLLQAEISQ
ncbi:MAG: sulfate ABC transporter ATP-binding protein, partial [Thalassospira sp.]|nr:sulfate ABC transporter ATP-binding protein [Thalassospira sp.]